MTNGRKVAKNQDLSYYEVKVNQAYNKIRIVHVNIKLVSNFNTYTHQFEPDKFSLINFLIKLFLCSSFDFLTKLVTSFLIHLNLFQSEGLLECLAFLCILFLFLINFLMLLVNHCGRFFSNGDNFTGNT